MRTTLAALAGLALGFGAASCQTTQSCSAQSCSGCCDETGRCLNAGRLSCGKDGEACRVCGADEACRAGVCTPQPTDGGGGTDAGTPPPTYGAFLDELAKTVCDRRERCGYLPSWGADCLTRIRRSLSNVGPFSRLRPVSERSVALGAVAYDPSQGLACIHAVAALHCLEADLEVSVCGRAVTPVARAGDACDQVGDCQAAGLACVGPPCARRCGVGGALDEACRADGTCDAGSCVDSVCRAFPRAGQACVSRTDCGLEESCNNFRCVTNPSAGEPCTGACQPDARCVNGTCQRLLDAGAACTSIADCIDGACIQAVCSSPLPDGAPCVSPSDCVSFRCVGNTCVPRLSEGAACDPNFVSCASGLACDANAGTCQPYRWVASGESCTLARRCEWLGDVCHGDGGAAFTGTCGPIQAGDHCTSHYGCGPGLYCDAQSQRCRVAAAQTPCATQEHCPNGFACSNSRCTPKAGSGGPCVLSSETNVCASNAEACLPTATPGEYRCQRLPLVGESCTTRCLHAECDAGTCVPVGRLGQSCLFGNPGCLEGECLLADGGLRVEPVGGTCVPPRPLGASCWSGAGCQSGHCDRTTLLPGVCAVACN